MSAPSVALVAGWYYPDSVGGTEAYVHALARALQPFHRVVVMAPSRDGSEACYMHDGVEIYRYPVEPSPTRETVQNADPPRELAHFERFLREWNPHIVHLHSITRGVNVHHARAARAQGRRLLLTVHVPGFTCPRGTLMRWGTVPCDGRFERRRCGACSLQARGLPRAAAIPVAALGSALDPGGARGRLGTMLRLPRLLERGFEQVHEVAALSERVVVVCEWLKEVAIRNGIPEDKLLISRHGLPPGLLGGYRRPEQRDGPLRIGYLGRFDPIKGVHILIEAVRSLHPETEIELELYGVVADADRAYYERLQALAAPDPRIRFGGRLTDENRRAVMSGWRVLAVPSIWFETGPLVVLEAFAAGIPVLGSALGGIVEWVEEGKSGFLVEAGNVAAWREAIRRLAARYAGGAWAFDFPPLRSTQTVADEMAALYERMLSPGAERNRERDIDVARAESS